MSRTRRPKPKRSNTGVQLAQVVGLVILLTMILLFRDKISFVAGSVLGGFESEDLKKTPEPKPPEAPKEIPVKKETEQ